MAADSQYLHHPLDLQALTPARIDRGRAGTRPRTAELLLFRADHAAARDAVLTELPDDFPDQLGCVASVRTCAADRREYLLRPDLGRRIRPSDEQAVAALGKGGCDVLVVVGDGLSSNAVASQAPLLLPPLLASLETLRSGSVRGPIFVRNARVGAMNHLGELAQATVVVLLVGERPGLSTSRSLSVYMGWMPRSGCTDAHRNVISNIHELGLPAQQAADVVTRWVAGMFRESTSGAHFSV
ncbi:MAG: ethanolamine ammonia-lyase subunit EutC [Fibrobacteres bacterium]|nr:ethanolamine ammonia-lyase subunit EutC [Fibrobacterota bacterium]